MNGQQMKIICDTNVLLFDALQPERLTHQVCVELEQGESNKALACSDISLWEIAMLIAKKRIIVDMACDLFIKEILSARKIQVLAISAEIAALSQSNFFLHGNPADRIIAATALQQKSPLLTSDKKLHEISQIKTIWK